MKYYGSDLEDKFIVETFKELPKKGVFVDVGAGPDGISGSNTYWFEQHGWTGVAIDADPRNEAKLKKNRKAGISALISNKEGSVPLNMSNDPDVSGIIPNDKNKGVVTLIQPTKLEKILQDYKIGTIDVMSLDTEGSEIDVFESMDFELHRPKILIVEAVTNRKLNPDIEPYFLAKDYVLIAEVGSNLIFAAKKRVKRDPHLMIYGSSYDRGLEHLLKMWPDIRKEVPDAKLHVFYGWNLFDKVYSDNPERMAWREKINKLMEQEGITHLGRISHGACIKEHQMAGVWAYPTHFGEISCITAMRAQVYGSVPCVINYAALRETVKYGVKIEGDIYEPEVKKLYCDALIGLLKDEVYQEQVRKEMMPVARQIFAWSVVAKQWSDEFKREVTPETKALQLILRDEPLEALKITPNDPKLISKLAHMFNPDKYKEKYANDPMNWKPETLLHSRHTWILDNAIGAKNLIDLGCYEGSLVDRANQKGINAKGVELCKEAVKLCKSRKLNVVEGDASNYQDGDRYDAVCACEVIEHVPDPVQLIENMVSLVSDTGWAYITTPNGPYDLAGTQKVWDDEDALIDHVRCYNKKKMEEQLAGYECEIVENGKELYVRFRRNLEKLVEELMDNNQALQAWDVVKDTNSPLREKVYKRVRHAFDKEAYRKYYTEDLEENPMPEDQAKDCTLFAPRFRWLVNRVELNKHKTLVDLGCADGYLCLTLAQKGVKCTGVNMYGPSINVARERASKWGLDCEFKQKNLFDVEGKYDAVVLFEVLEHLPDPKEAIDKCMSLVGDGGRLYISTPRTDHIGIEQHKAEIGRRKWDEDEGPSGHLRIFTEGEIIELLKDYKIEQMQVDSQRNMLLEVSRRG
jgi:FkbM family methyltransferase